MAGLIINNTVDSIVISGTSDGDSIVNVGADVTIDVGDGDNTVESTAPNVLFRTGAGNNVLTFYTGSDNGTILAGDGDDTINVVGNHVTVNGGAGNDNIRTFRNAFDITVRPGRGDDRVAVNGDAGGVINRNLIQYADGDGNDSYSNLSANDSVQVLGAIVGASLIDDDVVMTVGSGTITFVESNNRTINILDADGKLTQTVFSGGASDQTLIHDTIIIGTNGDDSIVNDGYNVTIDALSGDDTITNTGDDVLINAGDGDNFVSVTSSNVTINTGVGNSVVRTDSNGISNLIVLGDGENSFIGSDRYTTLFGGAGADGITLHNGSDRSYVDAGGGNDTIAVGHSNITIEAGDGDDAINLYRDAENAIIDGGKGDDTITVYNNQHAQTYLYNDGDGDDLIIGFDDDDTLKLIGVSSVSSIISGDDVILNFGTGSITLADASDKTLSVVVEKSPTVISGAATVNGFVIAADSATLTNFTAMLDSLVTADDNAIEVSINGGTVTGSDVHNYINIYGSDVVYNGGDYIDNIRNFADGATIFGNGGDDHVQNYAENSIIDGGEGDDRFVDINAGHATFVGGKGNDALARLGDGSVVILYADGDGLDQIAGLSTRDSLQLVDSTINSVLVAGTDVTLNLDDGAIVLPSVAGTPINVNGTPMVFGRKWTKDADGNYAFVGASDLAFDEGTRYDKWADFTLSGGSLVDEDGDNIPDGVSLGAITYIQQSGVHTNIDHLRGNVNYNGQPLGIEGDDDYNIEAISPIDTSEHSPLDTYVIDPNITAMRNVSDGATVSQRDTIVADWISIDTVGGAVSFRAGEYCVYCEADFSSHAYTKLSSNQDFTVTADAHDITKLALGDGYQLTIEGGVSVNGKTVNVVTGGDGTLVVKSTDNTGKYSLRADADDWTVHTYEFRGDGDFSIEFDSNGSVATISNFDGELVVDSRPTGGWSHVGDDFIYSSTAWNEPTQSASFTIRGSALIDADGDGAPDGASVTAFQWNTAVGMMAGLDGIGGEVSLNGVAVGVIGDDDYDVHFTAKTIENASESVLDYAKSHNIMRISDGATINITDNELVELEPSAKVHFVGEELVRVYATKLQDKTQIQFTDADGIDLIMNGETLEAISGLDSDFELTVRASDLVHDSLSINSEGGRGVLDLGDATYTVSNDDAFIVQINDDGECEALDGFDGLIAGGGSVSINGQAATLTSSLRPVEVLTALSRDYITVSGATVITDVYGDAIEVSAVTDSSLRGDGLLVGYGSTTSLVGGSGADSLMAKAIGSTLTGGAGADTFIGGVGLVSAVITDYTEGEDVIYYGQAFDNRSINGRNRYKNYVYYAGDQRITVKGGANKTIKTVDANGEVRYFGNYLTLDDNDPSKVLANSKVLTLDASRRTDDIRLRGNWRDNTIVGGSGTTTMTGGVGADVFVHGGGDDYITDYQASRDVIDLGDESLTGFSADARDVVLTTTSGLITVKGGANKTLTLTDSTGQTFTRTYSASAQLPSRDALEGVTDYGSKLDASDEAPPFGYDINFPSDAYDELLSSDASDDAALDHFNSGQYSLLASSRSSRINFATRALGTVFDNVSACQSLMYECSIQASTASFSTETCCSIRPFWN